MIDRKIGSGSVESTGWVGSSWPRWRSVVVSAIALSLCLLPTRLPAADETTHSSKVANESDRSPDAFDPKSVVESHIDELPITAGDREHWSFRPLERPRLPEVERADWPREPLDRFILARLEAKGLLPARRADRTTLLRRVKFDLVGLPPTPEEIHAFEQDHAPGAYERMVERFLSSPAYGERWGQHWLDLARFAETDGFELDQLRDGAWQYRQWVIDALNADFPYDRFVAMQLAGDLLAQPTAGEADRRHSGQPIKAYEPLMDERAGRIATMFCMAGPDMPDINEQELRRHDKLNEISGTVGAVLLGLQMQCAQCHDHKFDPISQADFYRLRAIFDSAVPEMQPRKQVLWLEERPEPSTAWLCWRGDVDRPGPELQPRPPRIASDSETEQVFADQTPRVALVEWLFREEQPLTSRVIANRVWQHHFGNSLCENPSDVGVVTAGPSHPDMLDWLATELRRKGWSLKTLHRTLLLSATYQQASYPGDGQQHEHWRKKWQADPENYWYSRFSRRRLEGEIIRDAVLAASGQLNRHYGGASVMPSLPPELLQTLLNGQWRASEEKADHCRRSIYVFARRNLRYPIFEAFDRPDAGTTCARRDQSTTAIQALHLLNSNLTLQAADRLGKSLVAEYSLGVDAPASHWHAAFERILLVTVGRIPEESELAELLVATRQADAPAKDQLSGLALALFNSNAFIYLD